MATTRLRDTARTLSDNSPARLDFETSNAEALSRNLESHTNILAGRASRAKDGSGFQERLDQKNEELRQHEQSLEELRQAERKQDLSGTRASLSDSEGHFAPNAHVARTGGIGVSASNTGESGQAGDPEEVATRAAQERRSPAGVVFGPGGAPIDSATGEPVGEVSTGAGVTVGGEALTGSDGEEADGGAPKARTKRGRRSRK